MPSLSLPLRGPGHSLTPGAGGGPVSTEAHGLRVAVPKGEARCCPRGGDMGAAQAEPQPDPPSPVLRELRPASVLHEQCSSQRPLPWSSWRVPPLSSRLCEATSVGDPACLPRPVLCLSSQRSVKPPLHPHFVITVGLPVNSMHEGEPQCWIVCLASLSDAPCSPTRPSSIPGSQHCQSLLGKAS